MINWRQFLVSNPERIDSARANQSALGGSRAKPTSGAKAPTLPEGERQTVARALGYALATIDALESQLGNSPPPADEKAKMRALVEVIVSDDKELEQVLQSTSTRVTSLSGSRS